MSELQATLTEAAVEAISTWPEHVRELWLDWVTQRYGSKRPLTVREALLLDGRDGPWAFYAGWQRSAGWHKQEAKCSAGR